MRICFTTQVILPFFNQSFPLERLGGAEIQQFYLGKYLSEKDCSVIYLSHDYNQNKIYRYNKISFVKTYSSSEGLPGLRFFYPRLSKIWRGLKIADADIYFTRGEGFIPGILKIFCEIYKKKYVFSGAHDTNFIPGQRRLRFARDRILFEYGFKRADAIIVQSENQHKLLKENYGIDGTIIRNIYPEKNHFKVFQKKHILWVANLREFKRPELYLDIAKKFPQEKFIMIGGSAYNSKYYDNIKNTAESIPNLDFKGFIPFEETEQYFDGAKFFVNTSKYEGFPNTFLQAWCRGIPVVTFVDPERTISQKKLGMVVTSSEEFYQAVRIMSQKYLDYYESVIQYYKEYHSPKNINNYIELFRGLLKDNQQ